MIGSRLQRGKGKKKVLMIVYTIYPFDARVRREAETLTASGSFDVTVLCLREGAAAQIYSKEKVSVRELNSGKYLGTSGLAYVISYLSFLIKAFIACSCLFLRKGIDIVHVHNMPNFLVFAAIIPKLFGKPIILDMHDSMPDTFEAKFRGSPGVLFKILNLEEKVSAWISDRIICVNQVQKDVTAKRGIPVEKIFISMNVPDNKMFKDLRPGSRMRKEGGTFELVYHGTMTERLGIDLAIEVVTKLRPEIPGLELHLWGRGDDVDFLRERCKQLGNEEAVFFHETVPIDELSSLLADMDVGVVPNKKSSATDLMLPVKLLEYIALGIPVVAPKLKAIQYYFTDDMVSFFEPENVDEMAKAILRLYRDDSRGKLQSEKAKAFLRQYGWVTQSKDFINFYRGI